MSAGGSNGRRPIRPQPDELDAAMVRRGASRFWPPAAVSGASAPVPQGGAHDARTSCTRRGLAATGIPEGGAALRAVPLDGRPALDDLVAPGALEQRRLEPPARARGAGERALARRCSPPMQHTAGPGPPEPSCGAGRGHPLKPGPGRRGPHPGARRCLPPTGLTGRARTPRGPPGAWCGPASPAASPLQPALPPGDGRAAPRLPPADPDGGGSRRRARESAGGPGQNRTATAEGEGFTDPWAHHLPNRPTSGGDEGTRTPDPRDANAVLSQLSYIPTGAASEGIGATGREV
jgi:hypothetical protein